MKRIIQRLVGIVGVSGSLIAAVQAVVDAFVGSHSEPVVRDHR